MDSVIPAEAPTTAPAALPADEAGPSSVLVVDDNEPSRDILARWLSVHGYRVAEAADGRAALDRIGRDDFDLVLLDISMPGLDGLQVLEAVRRGRDRLDLPVVMVTAHQDGEEVARALDLGANDYVTKPLDFPAVLARVRTQLDLRRSVRLASDLEDRLRRRNAELEEANADLLRAGDRLRRDLRAAARVQEALLPRRPVGVPGWDFAWAFRPCEELAGDALNVCRLDDRHAAAYVLDVAGHGVAAALLAVTVTRLLSPAAGQESLLLQPGDGADGVVPPAAVADRLALQFPFDPATQQYLTLNYAVIDTTAGRVRYVSAGHPPAVHLPRGGAAGILPGTGLPVGLGAGYEEHVLDLAPGDRLVLYSDGVPEAVSPGGEQFGRDRLLAAVEARRGRPLADAVAALEADLLAWCGPARPRDDVSVLAVERLAG
ncbi:MAG: SpoIIE family protein phosphatase [Gemmataceae bacterium]|nr:SpoIIE family protein phosphatase [Gemmataceae bacterium]